MTSLNSPPEETLYRRLGGYDVIAAVIDEFLSLFRSDPRFARFGGGRSLDSIQRGRQWTAGTAVFSTACSSSASSAVSRPISTRSNGLMKPSLIRNPPARAIASRSGTAQ